MPFQVQLGNTAVTLVQRTLEVYVRGSGTGRSAARETFQNATRLQVPAAALLYINEAGRNVRVRWQAPPGGAQVPVGIRARQQQGQQVVKIGPHWDITPLNENVKRTTLDGDFQDDIRSPQQGAQCAFRTSMCGLDAYLVSYYPAGGVAGQHLFLRVRKRLRCHYREMAPDPNQGGDNYSLRACGGVDVLAQVIRLFAVRFGIFIEIADTTTVPYHAATHAGAQLNVYLQVPPPPNPLPARPGPLDTPPPNPAAATATRGPRELWIGAMAMVQDRPRVPGPWMDRYGVGGQSAAAISVQMFKNNYAAARPTVQPTPERVRRIFGYVIMHEIGHALGLVQANQASHDAAHAGHCSTRSCVMFWESDQSAGYDPLLQTRGWQEFDGYPRGEAFGMDGSNCWQYLRACNLSDIRTY